MSASSYMELAGMIFYSYIEIYDPRHSLTASAEGNVVKSSIQSFCKGGGGTGWKNGGAGTRKNGAFLEKAFAGAAP